MEKPLIGIIGGEGKMGNWFKNFFTNQGLSVLTSDKKDDNRSLAKKADIVIVSVPIAATVKVIEEIRNCLRKDALLTDFTSLKTESCRAMEEGFFGALGMHPLFGPLAVNLENQTIVFCPLKKNKWIGFLESLFEKNGAKIIKVSPEKHDKQMAFIQALTHFSNIASSHFFTSQDFRPENSFLTPVFKLQSLVWGRILAQDAKLYADIEMRNPYFQKILKDYVQEIESFSREVAGEDYQAFEKRFKQAKSYLADSIKTAEEKTSKILKMVEKQPLRIGRVKKVSLGQNKIGFLGPKGTFSWAGAEQRFKRSSLVPFLTIRDIFVAVNDGVVDYGVVPIQNTIAGLVAETINCFIDFPVFATGSFNVSVRHCLLSKEKNIKKIKIVSSHPQALSQCRVWLENNLPGVVKNPTSSTVAPILEGGAGTAFIASAETAKLFKLNILAENIENEDDNLTRFFLISREPKSFPELKASSTILLLSAYNRPGALRDILNIFAKDKINLTSLHSVPSPNHAWDYFFFLEIESKKIQKSVAQLNKYCPFIKLIGLC
ncbi:MAG: prephenate dehydrogenase/arogenate dehydrogenase family protein [bacterium]